MNSRLKEMCGLILIAVSVLSAASSTRPFKIARFSELYFVAAEAAVKGAATVAGKTAYDLINVIRARAGKWSFGNNNNTAKVEDNSAAMVSHSPLIIDIDYFLEERQKEGCRSQATLLSSLLCSSVIRVVK